MSILKSRVYKEKIGRGRTNFQVLLENVGLLILMAFYGTIVAIYAWGQTMPGLPYRTQKPNTPLSDEEQVWDVSGIGIREPEKDLKWRIQFQLPFGDSFQSKVTFAWPWSTWRQQCRTSQTSWTKEGKCLGRPGATSADKPWKGVELQGVSCCRFRRWFERLKQLRFGGSLSFICETGNPTASCRSMHFRGSFAEVAPGRREHFSTAVHGRRARSCTVAFSCSTVKQLWTNPQSVVATLLSTRHIF